ncbi:hypothetical protein HMPREF9141_0381 [Prevotella multiformis DSM 16608]|uniref:Uncharacterized protein n=1 Tax=Prevotella multiformis DSM 16608 TaxID=888743 RepID=F0F465_9BACT|nr:hypothetical protein HMPREF9141_0381 [Prevotella multiformis DSM 16608]
MNRNRSVHPAERAGFLSGAEAGTTQENASSPLPVTAAGCFIYIIRYEYLF